MMPRSTVRCFGLLLLFLLVSERSFAAFIRYGGFGFEPAHGGAAKKGSELCLAIIEVSPFESRSIIYQQEQFYILLQQKPAIREHISDSLGLDSLDFGDFLHLRQAFQPQERRCIGLSDFYSYLKNLSEPLPAEAPIIRLLQGQKQTLAFILPDPDLNFASLWMRTADLFDPYIIKHYSDPLEETEKRWQPGDLFPEGQSLSQLQDSGTYLEVAHKFLAYYAYVGQVINIKKVKTSAKNMADTGAVSAAHLPEAVHTEATHKKDDTQVGEQADAELKVWSVRLLRAYTVDKRFESLAAKIKAACYPTVFPKQEALPWRQRNLAILLAKDEKHQEKMALLKSSHQQQMLKIPAKLKGKVYATKEYEELKTKINHGSFSQEDFERYQELKAEIEFGIRGGSEKFSSRASEKIKNALRFYNFYGTDTIADRIIEYSVELTLKQLLPLDKRHNQAYRLSRFGDGLFVMTTTILGLTLIPFTGGLSMLAAGGVGVLTTDFFSVLGSLARHEPLDSMLARLAIRSAHTFVNGFVPVWNEGNSFFTSMDDLRVGAALDHRFYNLCKGEKRVLRARPEVLGRPFVLALLQERLKYLREELLPLGKTLYLQADFTVEQERFFFKTLGKLQRVEHELAEDLMQAVQRYEYLLARGRIPNSMHFDIEQHLQRYRCAS